MTIHIRPPDPIEYRSMIDIGRDTPAMHRYMEFNDKSFTDIINNVVRPKRALQKKVTIGDKDVQFTEQGAEAIQEWVFGILHQLNNNPIFTLTPPLVQMLLDTEIENSLPVSYVKLPNKTGIYLHSSAPHEVADIEGGGTAYFSGVYIREATSFSPSLRTEYERRYGKQPVRQIDFQFIISSESGEGRFKGMWMSLEIVDENEPILDIVERVREGIVMKSLIKSETQMEQYRDAQGVSVLKHLVGFAAKALLYTCSKQYREIHVPDYTSYKEEVDRKKGSKKKKATRRLERLYDYILIGPVEDKLVKSTGESNKQVRAHFRRGHFRRQRHGPKRSMEKLIFIEPIIVSANHEGVDPKDYVVG